MYPPSNEPRLLPARSGGAGTGPNPRRHGEAEGANDEGDEREEREGYEDDEDDDVDDSEREQAPSRLADAPLPTVPHKHRRTAPRVIDERVSGDGNRLEGVLAERRLVFTEGSVLIACGGAWRLRRARLGSRRPCL